MYPMHNSMGIAMRRKAKHIPYYKTITIGGGSVRSWEGEKCSSYPIADSITMLSHTHTHTHKRISNKIIGKVLLSSERLWECKED